MNSQTKVWPNEKSSTFESASATSKRHHKHKHHHHRHHNHHHKDKHHHHHHRRATSAESIRNRQHQAFISPTKMAVATPQYIEQNQQQQQQQPMIVYREVGNGEGYTVDPNGLATVPYGIENETTFVDDQQAPMFVYRDQQPMINDGTSQQIFFNPEQETVSSFELILR